VVKTTGQEKMTLATANPELAKQWHKTKNLPLTPKDVAPNSNKSVWWICNENKNHVWEARIQSRNSGRGCGLCRGLVVVPGVNDLVTLFPKIARTWDGQTNLPLEKTKISPTSSKRVNWICKLGHSYTLPINSRVAGTECQVCNNHQILPGFNDLKTLFPRTAKEFAIDLNEGKKPETVGAGSGTSYWWRCSKGHTWKAKVTNRTVLNASCPSCSKKRVEEGETDFGSLQPELAKEWSLALNRDVNPRLIGVGSQAKFWWDCSKGHSWNASVADRVKGQGCAVCANRQVVQGVNDLFTTHPHLAGELAPGLNDKDVQFRIPAGTPKKLWWKCSHNHEWQAAVSSRALAEQGCPYCSGNLVIKGENDLESLNPDLAQEWHFLRNAFTPDSVKSGSDTSVWWLCKRGHEWKAPVSRRSKGSGCPYCSNIKLLEGFNDLATIRPDLSDEWNYEKNSKRPTQVLSGTHTKFWWKCEAGHTWNASAQKRIQGRGCPTCAPSGFVPGKPAILYFLEHEKWRSFKVGISNTSGHRLKSLESEGWTLILKIDFTKGSDAQLVEKESLNWIRNHLGLLPFVSEEQMKRTGGWTETFSSEGVPRSMVVNKIHSLAKSLDSED
jgi:hypothetical protein